MPSYGRQNKNKTETIMQTSGGVDLISNLPDDILHQILSFLPMKSLVRTSILSTRWRYLWTFTSNLVFDIDHFRPPEEYAGIINRCMQLHKATKIHTLDIHLPIPPDYFANGEEWILFAAARQVEELNFRRVSFLGLPISLPNSLFYCKTLSALKLNCFILSIPSDFDGFKSLKTLYLSDVSLKTEQIRTFLSACPFIETLEIREPYEDEYEEDLEIAIESQHLKKLVLSSFVTLHKLEIDAPNLLFFEFRESILPRLSMKNTSHCQKVKLSFERGLLLNDGEFSQLEDWENMVQYIAHTENFTLGEYNDLFLWYGLYCSQRFTFTNLKELHWYGDCIELSFLIALVTFIQDCPALEKVCLDIQITLRTVVHEDSKSEIPAYTPHEKSLLKERWLPLCEDPNYSLQHLKTVKIMGFSGNWIQMQLLKFLLDKAVLLDLLLVIFPEKKKISKRLIWKQLTFWPKASSHVRILLSDFPKVYTCPTHLP